MTTARMTDRQITVIQNCNSRYHRLRAELLEMLDAPVVASIYDEEADQYSDDILVLEQRDIYTTLQDTAQELARCASTRRNVIDTYRSNH